MTTSREMTLRQEIEAALEANTYWDEDKGFGNTDFDACATALEELFEKRIKEKCLDNFVFKQYVNEQIEKRIEPLRKVYEQFNHLDKVLSTFSDADDVFGKTANKLWQAIKSVVEGELNVK
jgi:hypothetical protein